MMKTTTLVTLLLLALPPDCSRGQILNTLRGFENEEPGWSGEAAALISGAGGNTEHVSMSLGGRVQWQSTTSRVRLIGRFTRKESGGEKIAQEETVHLRHNHRIRTWLHSLAFVQAQQNPFQRLRSRTLVGAGLRADLLRRPQGRISLGGSPMWETERIEEQTGHEETWRLSTFLTVWAEPREGVSLSATGFYQPRFSDPADARAVADLTLEIDLVGNLALIATAGLQYNARPPATVERTDWNHESGFRLRL